MSFLGAERRNTKHMKSCGASHYTFHLFSGKTAAERKRRDARWIIRAGIAGRLLVEVVLPLKSHTILKSECVGGKDFPNETCTICQQPFDNVDVHLVAVPANRVVAVDISLPLHSVQ